jgi:Ca2+/Na+ antiporter
MTAWSSVQRKPSGMTSSLGMFVGIVVLMPEFFLLVVLGNSLLWLEGVVALSLLVVVVLLLLSLDRLIRREKFLP